MGDCNTLKSFPNPRHWDPHLDQTKHNDLLPLTIDGVLGLNISQTQILSVSQYPKGHIAHLSGQSNLKEIVMMSIINHDLLVISEYRCEVFNNWRRHWRQLLKVQRAQLGAVTLPGTFSVTSASAIVTSAGSHSLFISFANQSCSLIQLVPLTYSQMSWADISRGFRCWEFYIHISYDVEPKNCNDMTQFQLCKRLSGPIIPLSWSGQAWKRVLPMEYGCDH